MKQKIAAASSVPPLPDEITLGVVLRGPTRKPVYLRIAGWCLVVGCALSMGTILASNPRVTEKLSSLTETVPQATEVQTTPLTSGSGTGDQNPEFSAEGTPIAAPGRLMSALGALSQSARNAMGYGDPMEYVDLPADATAEQSDAGLGSLFASDEPAARPAVTLMPQSRIPVRRAGISN